MTEALCDSVDFVWIDLEHNPMSVESMMGHLIAARAGRSPALVRIPCGDVGWIKRVLDSGAEGIILPQASSAKQVRAFVSACRYPPMGTRGYGPRRPSNYGRDGGIDYMQRPTATCSLSPKSKRSAHSTPSTKSLESKGSTRSCWGRRI